MIQKTNLSVAIITKNEEKRLPDCLKSVEFASDIVVVDSGSTDRTVEVAKSCGCRVLVEGWKGHGPQKNSAVEKCLNEWVLLLDADERVPEATKQEIIEVLHNPTADVYSFPRKNYLHGHWIKHSDWWPDRQTRLFKKSSGRFQGAIHSDWKTDSAIKHLSNPIEHYSFPDYSSMLRKLDDYSTAIAKELLESGKRANLLSPVTHGIGMFFKTYILKMGFLDGMDGLVISLLKAGGSFFKYAKMLEAQYQDSGKWTVK